VIPLDNLPRLHRICLHGYFNCVAHIEIINRAAERVGVVLSLNFDISAYASRQIYRFHNSISANIINITVAIINSPNLVRIDGRDPSPSPRAWWRTQGLDRSLAHGPPKPIRSSSPLDRNRDALAHGKFSGLFWTRDFEFWKGDKSGACRLRGVAEPDLSKPTAARRRSVARRMRSRTKNGI
jgi:hypothetical protein